MRRKLLLGLAALVTSCNLAVGAYAMACQGAGGARTCGEVCVKESDGTCACRGECTNAEMNWVAGAGKLDGPIAEMEALAN